MKARFSIQTLLLVILCTAICIAWWSNSTTLKHENARLQKQLDQLAKLNTALNRETIFLGQTSIDTDHYFNSDPLKSTMDLVLDVQRRRTNLMFRILDIQSNTDNMLQRNKDLSTQTKIKILKTNIADCQKLKKQFQSYSALREERQSQFDGEGRHSRFSDEEQLSLVDDEIAYWEMMLEQVAR